MAVKVADASERVKVSCAVCPARRVPEAFDVMVTVGATMSMAMGAIEPARFWLPALSVKDPAATEMVPVVPLEGVKTAV